MSVTQDDVAARAGVSRALVSLALRGSGRVSEPTRELILRTAAELGYRTNVHAAQLASHSAMIIGVVMTQFQNPIFPSIFRAAEVAAEAQGYGVLSHMGDMGDPAHERRAIDRLLTHRVDGIILFATTLPAAEVRALAAQIPLVTAGRARSGVSSVAVDSRGGSHLAVDHLVSLGHRRIAHIDGGNGAGALSRRRGFLEAMNGHRLGDHVLVVGGDHTEAAGISAAETLLAARRPPSAIFAFNDMTAIGVLAAARERHVRVPDDLSVVGFDDAPASSLRYIDLTTIAQPRDELGTKAVTMLLEQIQNPSKAPRSRLVTPHLVVRSSTGPVRA